jgi:HAD superfamily hydrolase (TIGR01509 family)
MKPDRGIYDTAIERAGVAAHEVFFTDDRPENIAGALAAGIDAVAFTSCDKLIAELRKRGVAGV